MKVICWNVNSINSRTEHILDLIQEEAPDILLLQELKCEELKFPHMAFAHLPYNISINGQKTYNGVAIFSKYQVDETIINFPNNPIAHQARFIEISFNSPRGFSKFISVYVPNGGEVGSEKFIQKTAFLKSLTEYLEYLQSLSINILIGGDFNIAPFDIDTYNPLLLKDSTCFTFEERELMRTILNLGYIDLFRLQSPHIQEFSWWDYRGGSFEKNQGMRIDFILANPVLSQYLDSSTILSKYRALQKPSDHAPVSITFR